MGSYYRFTGFQDPASRPDRIEVESPTDSNPEGLVLELNGPAKELSDDQVTKLSRLVTLELVENPEDPAENPQWVDQPGIQQESQSTDDPPQLGTTPDLDAMNGEELKAELERVRQRDPNALSDLKGNARVDDLRSGLQTYHTEKGV